MSKSHSLTIDEIGKFLATYAEKSDDVYWLSSADFKNIVYISPAYEKIWGRSRETLYNDPTEWLKYIVTDPDSDYNPIQAMAKRVIDKGSEARFDEIYRIVRPNGDIRWIQDHGFPIYNKKGQCCAITGVAIDITDVKAAEIALSEAKERAENANRAKAEFLAVMSHELRTPLHAIMGMAQVLFLDQGLASKQQDALKTIYNSGKHLLALITDILDFARIEAGNLEIKAIPFEPYAVFDELISYATYQTSQRDLNLLTKYDSKIPKRLIGDPDRLRQILINLLGNALKFTLQGEIKIKVDCLSQENHQAVIALSVEDTGIGIAQENLEKIFDRFTQVDTSYQRRYEGVGLGLTICKQLAEAMNGRIDVASSLDKGSKFTFTVSMPIPEECEKDRMNLYLPNTLKSLANAGRIVGKYQHKILLVEDNKINQKIAKLLLQELYCIVDVAHNGYAALEKFNNDYDLILMDIGLPDINGLEVTKEIRQKEKEGFLRTPIIALTAHVLESDRQNIFDAGVDDMITKPLMHDELLRILKRWGHNNALDLEDERSESFEFA